MKKNFVFFFLLAIGLAKAQNHKPVFELFANPFVQKFSNTNSYDKSNPDIVVSYNKIPSQDVGLNIVFQSKPKFNWFIGLNHIWNHYQMHFILYVPNVKQQVTLFEETRKINQNGIGLNVGINHLITSNLSLRYSLNNYLTYRPKDQVYPLVLRESFAAEHDSQGNPTSFYYFKYKFHSNQGGYYPQLLIPQIELKYRFLNNF